MLIEVERAEGCKIIAPNGKEYIDLISGIGVSSIGHSNPKVIKAVEEQISKHAHVMVYGEFVQSPSNRTCPIAR